jgi:myosin heavy subunit
VLDIFGFEVFAHNSFEQLCINYANEKLQQLFNLFVFKMELAVYKREDVDTSSVAFADNQPTLDLLDARPKGVLPVLDEECIVPNGSDEGFVHKIHNHHGGGAHDRYVRPRINAQRTFGIKHYAGDVTYSAENFLDKNNDRVSEEVTTMLAKGRWWIFLTKFFCHPLFTS